MKQPLPTVKISYSKALCKAMDEEVARDPTLLLIGEDVGLYGGAYAASKGLYAKLGGQVIVDSPISEGALMGIVAGMARMGYKPVFELMYIDFCGLVLDQFMHSGAFMPYMTGGKAEVPLVLRTEGGAGRNVSATHSKSLEAMFTMIPGCKVVMPYTPADAYGLLKTAIKDPNPVVFIEHKMLYGTKGDVPDDTDFSIPIGEATVRREGKDITLVSYSRMVQRCDEAAKILEERHGFTSDVIDLRSLAPWDKETVGRSLGKTGKALLVSEAWANGNFMNGVSQYLQSELFDRLDGPVEVLAGADIPMPMNPPQENASIPSVEDIVDKAMFMFGGMDHAAFEKHRKELYE